MAVLGAVPVLVACGLAGAAAAGRAPSPAVVAVFPSPGTRTAAPGTQVSVRGIAPDQVGRLVVHGSRTGRHEGRLVRHGDGRGASFVPRRPFAPGERVIVRVPAPVAGGTADVATFTIARAASRPRPDRPRPGP